MSEGNSIKIPTWALPIGAALLSGAIAWGSMQAQAQATADEVAEIKVKVEEADTTGKLNAQAIEQITQTSRELVNYDPKNPNLDCDLREWRLLETIQPPSERHEVALDWLRWNKQKCEYGGQIYIRNTMPRVLGTAHSVRVEMLTWELVRPEAEVTQAILKKRRL